MSAPTVITLHHHAKISTDQTSNRHTPTDVDGNEVPEIDRLIPGFHPDLISHLWEYMHTICTAIDDSCGMRNGNEARKLVVSCKYLYAWNFPAM